MKCQERASDRGVTSTQEVPGKMIRRMPLFKLSEELEGIK